jgi:tellurite resistance protein TerC
MTIAVWAGFLLLICAFLALDLGVFHKKDKAIGYRESLTWTAVWICVSMLFAGAVFVLYDNHIGGFGLHPNVLSTGGDAFLSYVSGYVVEYSLSIDNIFVIALVLSTFQVPKPMQHRVLFWGIIGALVLRGVMIGLGAVLLHRFSWMMYVFGAILVLTALRMALQKEGEEADVSNGLVVRLARRVFPLTDQFDGHKFFTRLPDGRKAATPLFLVLLLVESTDVLFAVDSIPAVFAVTQDPFLVFTSNIFAILGLRSLYFAIAHLLHQFHYLKVSLVVLLAFIGVKMLAGAYVHLSPALSLAIIALILGTGVVASLHRTRRHKRKLA